MFINSNLQYDVLERTSNSSYIKLFGSLDRDHWSGGGVGTCRWDPGTFSLYQSYCSSAEFCYHILE